MYSLIKKILTNSGGHKAALGLLLAMAVAGTAHAERRGFMLATGSAEQVRTDVQFLKNSGARIVRLPVYFGMNGSMDHWFGIIDAALGVTRGSDLTVVIDFHWPSPGVQGSTITNTNDFVARWAAVASRYKGEARSAVWYDLCNEPKAQNWRAIALRAARKIRTIDKLHPIVFAATSSTVHNVVPLEGIDHQILEFHFYNWGKLHNPAPPFFTYPDRNRGYTKAAMLDILKFVDDIGKKYHMPVYIGETAISRDNPTAPRYFKDFTAGCAKYNIHLTVHAFREASCWDYESTNAWPVLRDWMLQRP